MYLKKKKLKKTGRQSFHTMGCTCECTSAYRLTPTQCVRLGPLQQSLKSQTKNLVCLQYIMEHWGGWGGVGSIPNIRP